MTVLVLLTCLYVNDHWVLLSRFNTTTGSFPNLERLTLSSPKLVYRNLRGAQAFDNFSSIDFEVLWYFGSYFRGSSRDEFEVSVYHHRAALTIMLVLEGFGRGTDLLQIRDYRQDEVKMYTPSVSKILEIILAWAQ